MPRGEIIHLEVRGLNKKIVIDMMEVML